MLQETEDDDETDAPVSIQDCHGNHHHGHRHRYRTPDSSQSNSYHAYRYHRQNQPTPAIQPYVPQQNSNTRTVSMETDNLSEKWRPPPSLSETDYQGHHEYQRSISAEWDAPILGKVYFQFLFHEN